jgi:hypothetical protein
MAEIHTLDRKYVPPERTEIVLEQMTGRNTQLMEQALIQALARVRAGHTKSLMVFDFGENTCSLKAYTMPTLSKIQVVETLRTQLPGVFESLETTQ